MDLLDHPDQEGVRRDLATFFGPHADAYLQTYEKMRTGSGYRRLFPGTWSWSAFTGSFAWFFYRKMYAIGAAIVLLPVVSHMVFGISGSVGIWAAFTTTAKSYYVKSGLRRIIKADALGLSGAERRTYLRGAGGVSLVGAALAGIVYCGLLGATVLAPLVQLMK